MSNNSSLNFDPQNDEIVLTVSQWFQQSKQQRLALLPQHLPTNIIDLIFRRSQESLDAGQLFHPALLSIVGLLKADVGQAFSASREELALAAKAYSMNLMLEHLRRANIIEFAKDFSLDNILDISFERNFQLTAFGREVAKKAGPSLAAIFRYFTKPANPPACP